MEKKKIIKSPSIAVVGLGFVGLPLALEFSKKYPTIGFDKKKDRILQLKKGFDNKLEIYEKDLKSFSLSYTSKKADINNYNVYIVAVPTPVDKFNIPDLTPLLEASRTVGSVLNSGDVVIYESTVYPGVTEEFCVPILEKKSGLKYNVDFFCGYSPERVNPGDKKHTLTTIKKVTSGSNEETADFVDELYQSIIPAGTYMASSITVAEAAKVIENIQRDVNIALINELSMIFNKINLDTNEVLKAAETKWNFLPFRPGLVGGHCIGIDPFYLSHKATEIGYHPEIILASRRINDSMGKYIADCTITEMTKAGINPVSAKVAILGFTFKENCPDLRNTKVPDIINRLLSFGCKISLTDPYADTKEVKNIYNLNLVVKDNINKCNVIIVTVAHDDYKKMSFKKWRNLFDENGGVFIDVKGIVNKEFFFNTNISHWRL